MHLSSVCPGLKFCDSPFQAIENKHGQATGFVRYRSKKSAQYQPSVAVPIVPKHLIPSQTAKPVLRVGNEAADTVREKTSADYAAKAERLRKELETAMAERNSKIQALQAAKSRPKPPPPPANVSFGERGKKQVT